MTVESLSGDQVCSILWNIQMRDVNFLHRMALGAAMAAMDLYRSGVVPTVDDANTEPRRARIIELLGEILRVQEDEHKQAALTIGIEAIRSVPGVLSIMQGDKCVFDPGFKFDRNEKIPLLEWVRDLIAGRAPVQN